MSGLTLNSSRIIGESGAVLLLWEDCVVEVEVEVASHFFFVSGVEKKCRRERGRTNAIL